MHMRHSTEVNQKKTILARPSR